MPRPALLAVARRPRMHRKRTALALLQRPNQKLELDRTSLAHHQRSFNRQLLDRVQPDTLAAASASSTNPVPGSSTAPNTV